VLPVEHFLLDSAARCATKTAIVAGGRRVDYGELNRASDRVAAALRARGLQRGDRVAIQLENSVAAVIGIFGVLKAGGVFLPLNPSVKSDKLVYILNDCSARALFVDARWTKLIADVAASGSAPLIAMVGTREELDSTEMPAGGVWFDDLLEDTDAVPEHPGIDADLAALIYTSGSTGIPKGVMLTHFNIVSAATSITDYLKIQADDVILNVLPLAFDYGLYQVLMAVKTGATVVLERSFAYPPAVLETLARERVTGFPVVPTVVSLLLKHDLRSYDLSSLRYITNTGAALPTAHIQALREIAPHVRIFSMYGLTECKRVSYLPPEELDRRPSSVGKAMSNVEVFVVDEEGKRMDSGTGELVVRGSNVMRGYWGLPDETARVLRPGTIPGEHWLYSGDVFRIDEEGYLYFVGRKDDIIKSRGEKVSPKEVENILHSLPGVHEAAVIGVPDPVLGSAVKAFVVTDRSMGLDEREILRHCGNRMEDVMIPKYIELVDNLPRTPTGKVDRALLRDSLLA
jgi:long-chain acyl-CoA synthetase